MNPLNNLIVFFATAFLIAVTSFVYSYLLTQPGQFFGTLFAKLDILFGTDKRAKEGKGPHPLFKLIMRCEMCVAGQMATWIYLVLAWKDYQLIPHIFFISLSIFFSYLIKALCIKHIES